MDLFSRPRRTERLALLAAALLGGVALLRGEEPVLGPGMEVSGSDAETAKMAQKIREDARKRKAEIDKEVARRKGEGGKDKHKDDGLNIPVFTGLPQSYLLDADWTKKKPKKGETFFILGGEQDASSKQWLRHAVEESGKLKPTKDTPGADRESLKAAASGKMQVVPPPAKRSLWDKILGRNKEPDGASPGSAIPGQAVVAASAVELGGSGNAAPASGSLLNRVSATLAAKRLAAGVDPAAQEQARAAVVDLELPPSPVPRPEVAARTPAFGPRPAPEAGMEEDLRAAAERRCASGLASKDLVERDWAFRYAAVYRRAEALPALVQELRNDGVLAPLAVASLGEIGQATPDAVAALVGSLSAPAPAVRQGCALALGQLRAAAAAAPLLKQLKTERNMNVRAACAEALGRIGDRDAAGALRRILTTAEEAPWAKSAAALALARMGDHGGEKYLEECFSSAVPAQQVLGLTGLIELNGPTLPGFLTAALPSRLDEVWIMAVRAFPALGAARVAPMLRETLQADIPKVRHRAALALGLLGSREGLAYIQEALLDGGLAERRMAAVLLGWLGCHESVPLLIERLRDPQSAVRVAAALALVRLDAKEALPVLIEQARGVKSSQDLLVMRGSLPEVDEMLVFLGCIRALRGEEGEVAFKTLPDSKSTRWVEYDRQLGKYQLDLLQSYAVVEVMGAPDKPVAVVLRDPQGKEHLYREGEAVAAGYRIRDLHAGARGAEEPKDPPWVTLVRAADRITLIKGRPAEIQLDAARRKAGER
jgi:HEAT repeat protein